MFISSVDDLYGAIPSRITTSTPNCKSRKSGRGSPIATWQSHEGTWILRPRRWPVGRNRANQVQDILQEDGLVEQDLPSGSYCFFESAKKRDPHQAGIIGGTCRLNAHSSIAGLFSTHIEGCSHLLPPGEEMRSNGRKKGNHIPGDEAIIQGSHGPPVHGQTHRLVHQPGHHPALQPHLRQHSSCDGITGVQT